MLPVLEGNARYFRDVALAVLLKIMIGLFTTLLAILTPDLFADITINLLEGLKIMHAEGFTHRDLKPENIFVVAKSPRWWVKIGDFGISKRLDPAMSAFRTENTGTPYFMAPEINPDDWVEESPRYTNVVDIWSLGCVVYNILAMRPPFLSTKAKQKPFPNEPLMRVTDFDGVAFLEKLLVLNPTKRPTAGKTLEDPWLKTCNAELVLPSVTRPTGHSSCAEKEDPPKHSSSDEVYMPTPYGVKALHTYESPTLGTVEAATSAISNCTKEEWPLPSFEFVNATDRKNSITGVDASFSSLFSPKNNESLDKTTLMSCIVTESGTIHSNCDGHEPAESLPDFLPHYTQFDDIDTRPPVSSHKMTESKHSK